MKRAWQTVTGYKPAREQYDENKVSELKAKKDLQMQQSVTLEALAAATFWVGAADMDVLDTATSICGPPPSARSCARALVLQEGSAPRKKARGHVSGRT